MEEENKNKNNDFKVLIYITLTIILFGLIITLIANPFSGESMVLDGMNFSGLFSLFYVIAVIGPLLLIIVAI